jgi:TolB protein
VLPCLVSRRPVIAFQLFQDNENFEIYVAKADGTGLTRLTNSPAHDEQLAWSPDGQFISFMSHRGGDDGKIYIVKADGTGLMRLTNTPENECCAS